MGPTRRSWRAEIELKGAKIHGWLVTRIRPESRIPGLWITKWLRGADLTDDLRVMRSASAFAESRTVPSSRVTGMLAIPVSTSSSCIRGLVRYCHTRTLGLVPPTFTSNLRAHCCSDAHFDEQDLNHRSCLAGYEFDDQTLSLDDSMALTARRPPKTTP